MVNNMKAKLTLFEAQQQRKRLRKQICTLSILAGEWSAAIYHTYILRFVAKVIGFLHLQICSPLPYSHWPSLSSILPLDLRRSPSLEVFKSRLDVPLKDMIYLTRWWLVDGLAR